MSFGSRLRERREALGLRQSELGALLGITGSAIGNYENGVSSPRADILYKAFDILKCDANYLFQDEMRESEKRVLNNSERELLDIAAELNNEGIEKLIDYADDLVRSGKYIKNNENKLGEKNEKIG